jgi:hypothetical protein
MASRKGCLVAGLCFFPQVGLILCFKDGNYPLRMALHLPSFVVQYLSGRRFKISNKVRRGMGGCRGSIVSFVHKWQHRKAKGTCN